ncbi:MAG: MGMT family protein [Parachlamydiales bacterium]|nr:MGMT family protein [Parachlamydiales bacterium]
MGEIFSKIYQAVQRIPLGETRTYGEIAKIVGTTPRIVGFALHQNQDPAKIPCHRVVFQNGCCSSSYAFGGKRAQEEKLRKEKITKCRNESVLQDNGK